MSWQKVNKAFFVNNNGKFEWIDVAICSNCNGIHFSGEEANNCQNKSIITLKELKERYENGN